MQFAATLPAKILLDCICPALEVPRTYLNCVDGLMQSADKSPVSSAALLEQKPRRVVPAEYVQTSINGPAGCITNVFIAIALP